MCNNESHITLQHKLFNTNDHLMRPRLWLAYLPPPTPKMLCILLHFYTLRYICRVRGLSVLSLATNLYTSFGDHLSKGTGQATTK